MAKGRLKMVDKIRPQKVTIQYARRLRKWECMRHFFCCAHCFVKLGRDIFRKGSDRIIKLCDSDTMKQMKHVLLAVTVITALVMLLFTVFPSSPRMLRDYYGSDFSHEIDQLATVMSLGDVPKASFIKHISPSQSGRLQESRLHISSPQSPTLQISPHDSNRLQEIRQLVSSPQSLSLQTQRHESDRLQNSRSSMPTKHSSELQTFPQVRHQLQESEPHVSSSNHSLVQGTILQKDKFQESKSPVSSTKNSSLQRLPAKRNQLPKNVPSAPNATNETDEARRFVRMYENVNLTGAIINPVPSQVKWLEDLSHLGICNKTDPFILAVVFSALTHTKDRKRIRDTWAEPKYYKYTKLRAIFVLGTTENATLQKEVEEEIVLHQDIIQYNFIDSYRNLTYKTLSWMSWVRDYCLDVPWIAKIDDDLVVNPFNLNKYLVNQFKNNPAPREIHGRLRTKGKPWRKGKWNVSKKEYPAHKYPPFVLGPAYIVGRNAIDRIMAYAPYVPLLWLEDVYTTGLVAYAAGIKHVQAEKVLYTKKFTRKLYSGQLAFYIDANEKNKSRAWSYILKYSPAKRKSK